MYTKDIKLVEVAKPRDYEQLQRVWNQNLPMKDSGLYARVIEPLQFDVSKPEGYYTAIQFLLDHPSNPELRVRQGRSWVSVGNARYQRTNPELREIADIVSRDEFGKNFFELRLGRLTARDRAIIEFREYDNRLMGYDVSFTRKQESLFGLERKTEGNYKWANGLWVPDK